MRQTNHNTAFTLLELSIVILIIALLIGGISLGQNLVRSAKLKSVTRDAQAYTQAVHQFKEQYYSLPGDMPDATSIWGAQHVTPATCRQTESAGSATCDGDGDNFINEAVQTDDYESFRAWQHLVNANLLEGDFTGAGSPGTTDDAKAGINVPKTDITGTAFSFHSASSVAAGDSTYYERDYGNMLIFGIARGINDFTHDPAISTEEAKSIDNKLDDGHPVKGNILVLRTQKAATDGDQTDGCTDDGDAADADYSLQNTDKTACTMIFLMGL